MSKQVTESKLMNALDVAYEAAVGGIPGFDSAEDMANDYVKGSGSLRDKADSLIRWQVAKAATSGFLTGLGGILTLPIALPANITSVIYIQVRMVAAIAHIGGQNLRDDRVKTLVYACLCGNAAKDFLKGVGITVGMKLTEQAIKAISRETLIKINKAIGFRLLTKFGQRGAVNLGRTVPLIGGIIGAAFDGTATNLIGNIARDTFIPLDSDEA